MPKTCSDLKPISAAPGAQCPGTRQLTTTRPRFEGACTQRMHVPAREFMTLKHVTSAYYLVQCLGSALYVALLQKLGLTQVPCILIEKSVGL